MRVALLCSPLPPEHLAQHLAHCWNSVSAVERISPLVLRLGGPCHLLCFSPALTRAPHPHVTHHTTGSVTGDLFQPPSPSPHPSQAHTGSGMVSLHPLRGRTVRMQRAHPQLSPRVSLLEARLGESLGISVLLSQGMRRGSLGRCFLVWLSTPARCALLRFSGFRSHQRNSAWGPCGGG